VGLLGRVKNHLSLKYRQRDLRGDNKKLFYQYAEGMIDEKRTLTFVALVFFQFSKDQTPALRRVLSDIVELVFIVLLNVMDTNPKGNPFNKEYADLRPSNFSCLGPIIPTNRVSPCQLFWVSNVQAMNSKAKLAEVVDESLDDFKTKSAMGFKVHPNRPWIMAFVKFFDIIEIPVALNVLHRFRVNFDDEVVVRYDLWESRILIVGFKSLSMTQKPIPHIVSALRYRV